MKLLEKERALNLRKQGYSINEITTKVGVAKSTISLWVRNVALSHGAKSRIESLRTAGQRASQQTHYELTRMHLGLARSEAEEAIRSLPTTKDLALISVALLYWCEGAKSLNDQTLRFSNSDPLVIEAFMSLMRKAFLLDESKFRARMHLHEYHREKIQRKSWMKHTQLPANQFRRTYWKPNTGKNIHPGYSGCIHIDYYDVRIARKICAVARAYLKSVLQ